ncbi:hypothetical protein I302_105155 [Kwoniella bestiolae CBS 10118]|uniref:Uncharacterized protein n=1 Tax=Kwoniella bestiolae CBS 10118 TaxID=1296100 RepID=A0A1B9FSC1_9TREE|nr:hypothetical protein I302_08443 [Kwoniella bestiolae CBS 10118]OCF21666.1 hypothetical protein I302_08443 [Kwoniella bestiolae CBS 10118]
MTNPSSTAHHRGPDRVMVLDLLRYDVAEDGTILDRSCRYFDIPMSDISCFLGDLNHETRVSGPPHTFSSSLLSQAQSEGIPSVISDNREVRLMCGEMYALTTKLIGAGTEEEGDHAVAMMSLADAYQVSRATARNGRIGSRTRSEKILYDTLIRSINMPLGFRAVEWHVKKHPMDSKLFTKKMTILINPCVQRITYAIRSTVGERGITSEDWDNFLKRDSEEWVFVVIPGSFAVPSHLVLPGLTPDSQSIASDSEPETPRISR